MQFVFPMHDEKALFGRQISKYLEAKGSTVELQWFEHPWLVYHGCFELLLESHGTNPIDADLELFRMIFFFILRNGILCMLIRIASMRRF